MTSELYATVLDNIALNSIKYNAKYSTNILTPVTLISGAMSYHMLGAATQSAGVIHANASWNAFSSLSTAATGAFLWDEHLEAKQWVGVIGICISLYLLDGV